MNVRTALATISIAFTLGCSSSMPVESRPPTPAVVSKFVGKWEGSPGVSAVVTTDSTGNFHIHSNRSGKDRETVGELIDIDGTTVVKVCVYTPTKGEYAKGAVPLYVFGQLGLHGDTLEYTPIKAEWLAEAMKKRSNGTYVSTSNIEPHTGVAVVSNWAEMEAILREALSDPKAVGPQETFKRVKS